MMTDFEKMKRMLFAAGVEYGETIEEDKISLTIEGGYIGFYTLMVFTKDGTLKSVEAGE